MVNLSSIAYIHQEQLKALIPFQELNAYLKTKQRGLYWIWTAYTFDELAAMEYQPNVGSRHVNMAYLTNQRKDFQGICKVKAKNYQVIYNGIGGYKNQLKPSFGLRERIRQEFNCNNPRTGTLNISNTNLDTDQFAVSFFNFDDPKHHEVLPFLKEENAYSKYASEIEKLWRLQYGHPILCRH
ncbi:hypothetical protein OBK30_00060 [Empedobacter falsenii]